MRDSQIAVTGERELAYTEIGEPGWPCVFFFHGAPSSRLRLAYLEPQFLAGKVRVVFDALGIDRFVVAGHSAGGPYAVACAALLPDRVSAGIILGGVTDMVWPGAWQGYLETESQLMRLPDEDSAITWCVEQFGADGRRFLAASGFKLPAPDSRLYAEEEIAPFLTAARAEAFRQGVAGYARDVFLQGRPWPFDPSAIAAPVQLLHGELDTLLPLAHSRHTATLIPGATLRVLAGHGHFTILGELPTTASALARS